jgi:hypothetical protein
MISFSEQIYIEARTLTFKYMEIIIVCGVVVLITGALILGYNLLSPKKSNINYEIDLFKVRSELEAEKKLHLKVKKAKNELEQEKTKYLQEIKNLENELTQEKTKTRHERPSPSDRETYAQLFSLEEGQKVSVVEAYATMFATTDNGLKEIQVIINELKRQKKDAKSVLSSLTGSKKSRVPIIISPEILFAVEREIEKIRKSFRVIDENGSVHLMYENPIYDKAEEEYTKYLYLKTKSKNDYGMLPNTLRQLYIAMGCFVSAKTLEDVMAGGSEDDSQTPNNYPSEWSNSDGKLIDFYAELDLNPYDITEEELKKAYRKRSLQTHPDKDGSSEAFAITNIANEVLGDSSLKNKYDILYKQFKQN